MHKLYFLFAILISMQASAEDAVRCGSDAFGNEVCMDKNGVVSPAPRNQSGNATGKKANAAASSAESVVKSENEDQVKKPRCGIDPFGNKVCQ
jgi:hypothetical protein